MSKTIDRENKRGRTYGAWERESQRQTLARRSLKARAAKKIGSLVTSGEKSVNEPVQPLHDQSTCLRQLPDQNRNWRPRNENQSQETMSVEERVISCC